MHSDRAQENSGAARRLNFSSFATSDINECYDLIRSRTTRADWPGDQAANQTSPNGKVAAVTVTGSEARQLCPRLKETLGLDATVESEAECVARGWFSQSNAPSREMGAQNLGSCL